MKTKTKGWLRRPLFLAAAALMAVVATVGALAARYQYDAGHDIKATHDVYDTQVRLELGGKTLTATDGVYTISKNDSAVTEAGGFDAINLPLTLTLYYQGESYGCIRLRMVEGWYGTCWTDGAKQTGTEYTGILPERALTLKLNTEVPMADTRSTDNYLYLLQYQTTLTDAEVDTHWSDQAELLATRAADEELYKMDDEGTFTRDDENGTYKKIVVFSGVITPNLVGPEDGIYDADVKELRLAIAAETVQFNRYQEFWGIDALPARTNG